MKQYHLVLVKAKRNKKLSNHSVEITLNKRFFYYFGNLVCMVNDKDKTFELDDCGWGSHPSTKDCLAGYREYFTETLKYTQLNPKPIYKYEE